MEASKNKKERQLLKGNSDLSYLSHFPHMFQKCIHIENKAAATQPSFIVLKFYFIFVNIKWKMTS